MEGSQAEMFLRGSGEFERLQSAIGKTSTLSENRPTFVTQINARHKVDNRITSIASSA